MCWNLYFCLQFILLFTTCSTPPHISSIRWSINRVNRATNENDCVRKWNKIQINVHPKLGMGQHKECNSTISVYRCSSVVVALIKWQNSKQYLYQNAYFDVVRNCLAHRYAFCRHIYSKVFIVLFIVWQSDRIIYKCKKKHTHTQNEAK